MTELTERVPEGPTIYRVGDVLRGLNALLEERVGRLWIVGEISDLRRPASGHRYFRLKDDGAQIRATLFRGSARSLAFEPEDGLEVLAYGELSVYEPRAICSSSCAGSNRAAAEPCSWPSNSFAAGSRPRGCSIPHENGGSRATQLVWESSPRRRGRPFAM